MGTYSMEQAWALLAPFSQGQATVTLPDGTPADTLNTGTSDFGSYNVGPSDKEIQLHDPWQPTQSSHQGYSGYEHPIDTPPQDNTWDWLKGFGTAFPWGVTLAVVGGLLVVSMLTKGNRQ